MYYKNKLYSRYTACHGINLNGMNYFNAKTPTYADGIVDSTFRGFHHSLKSVTMAVKILQ